MHSCTSSPHFDYLIIGYVCVSYPSKVCEPGYSQSHITGTWSWVAERVLMLFVSAHIIDMQEPKHSIKLFYF